MKIKTETKKTLILTSEELALLEKITNLFNKIETELKNDYFIDTNGLVISSEDIFGTTSFIQTLYDFAEKER